jgi:hypothetical protein
VGCGVGLEVAAKWTRADLLRQPHHHVLLRRRRVLHRPPRVRSPVAPQPRTAFPTHRRKEGGADSGARGASLGAGDNPFAAVDGDVHGAGVEVERYPERLARLEPAFGLLPSRGAAAAGASYQERQCYSFNRRLMKAVRVN